MKTKYSPYKHPHRRLIINSGDIQLPRDSKIRPNRHQVSLKSHAKKDKLLAFKE